MNLNFGIETMFMILSFGSRMGLKFYFTINNYHHSKKILIECHLFLCFLFSFLLKFADDCTTSIEMPALSFLNGDNNLL